MMLEDTKEHKPSDVESQVDLDSPKLTSVDGEQYYAVVLA